MPLIPVNSTGSQRVTFNNGYMDFGTFGIVTLDNVKIEISVSDKQLRVLNSIKVAAIKRSTFTVKITGKVKSFNKEAFCDFFGASSVDGSGTLISFKDGQQATLAPVFTQYVNDDVTKPWQCQFTNAVILSMPISASIENYGEVDFEMIATDINIFDVE